MSGVTILVEAAAEADDDLMEKYLAEEEFTEEELKAAIRKGDPERQHSRRSSAARR